MGGVQIGKKSKQNRWEGCAPKKWYTILSRRNARFFWKVAPRRDEMQENRGGQDRGGGRHTHYTTYNYQIITRRENPIEQALFGEL